jgi:O-antigen/teichoic acid export membrane protein
VPSILNGRWGLFFVLLLSVVTFAGLYLTRGILGGHQRFNGYAATLSAEGLTRLIPLVALALVGRASALLIGLVFATGAAWGMLAGLPWLRSLPRVEAAEPSAAPRLGRSFGLMLSSSMLTQVMSNTAPVIAVSRLPSDPALGALIAAAFVVARIPLFVFSPVQTILLPRLVKAVVAKDSAAVRSQLGRALAAVAVLGVAGIAGAAVLGDWVLDWFFGARTPLPGWMLPALAAGTVLMMAMQVLQPALLAARRHEKLLGCWLIGSLCMLATALLLPQPAGAAVIGQLMGSAAVVAAAAVALSWSGRSSVIVVDSPRWSRESV